MDANTRLALRYHAAVESGATGADLAAYLTPDFVHHELPNALFPDGNLSDLPSVLAAAERGRDRLASQTYRVRNTVAFGDTVALEIEWTGTLRSGPTLRAHIATFLDFRDGRICAQRNYDCYERLPDL